MPNRVFLHARGVIKIKSHPPRPGLHLDFPPYHPIPTENTVEPSQSVFDIPLIMGTSRFLRLYFQYALLNAYR